MPTTKTTTKSSRVGSRGYVVPRPLRFASVEDAKKHIKANRLKVVNHETHTRGVRIHVVDRKGHTRTITIERSKNARNGRNSD